MQQIYASAWRVYKQHWIVAFLLAFGLALSKLMPVYVVVVASILLPSIAMFVFLLGFFHRAYPRGEIHPILGIMPNLQFWMVTLFGVSIEILVALLAALAAYIIVPAGPNHTFIVANISTISVSVGTYLFIMIWGTMFVEAALNNRFDIRTGFARGKRTWIFTLKGLILGPVFFAGMLLAIGVMFPSPELTGPDVAGNAGRALVRNFISENFAMFGLALVASVIGHSFVIGDEIPKVGKPTL